jgi:hypothetical protein
MHDLPAEGPAAFHGVLVGCGGVAAAGLCVWPACEGVPFIKARTRAVGRSPPSAVIEASALKVGADDQVWHQFKADDARDKAEAAAQSGQYPRWRRQVETVRLPRGPAPDMMRHARTRVRTARLSALTISPIFGPGMGRPDRVCPFASVR